MGRPVATRDRPVDPAAGDRPEAGDRREPELVLARPGEDGRPERMLAAALERAGQVEQVAARSCPAPW